MSEPFSTFKGAATRLDDIDLPRIGAEIGVGEDVVHMLLEVESLGDGFDSQQRPKMLFEPHVFYRNLKGEERARAVREGLAYKEWRRNYPSDSYPRLRKALAINQTAALKSASWGGSQILGENHRKAGYDTVEEFVEAMMADEANHVEAMISFCKKSGIADELRRIDAKLRAGQRITPADTAPIALVYNGEKYATHNYHGRLADSANKWAKIKDTVFDVQTLKSLAAAEDVQAELDGKDQPKTTAADASQTVVSTPTVVVEQEKAATVKPEVGLAGIKTHVAASIAFLTGSGSALIGWIQGASKILIVAFATAAAVVGIVYIIMRFHRANKAEAAQLERERMAHELTILKMKSAMDKDGLTVELAKPPAEG